MHRNNIAISITYRTRRIMQLHTKWMLYIISWRCENIKLYRITIICFFNVSIYLSKNIAQIIYLNLCNNNVMYIERELCNDLNLGNISASCRNIRLRICIFVKINRLNIEAQKHMSVKHHLWTKYYAAKSAVCYTFCSTTSRIKEMSLV